ATTVLDCGVCGPKPAFGGDGGKRTAADGAGATIGEHPDRSYPGKPTNLCWHRRSAPGPWRCAKAHHSGSKSGSGRWSHWDEIGWVHYPEIGWSHSDEIRWVHSHEILQTGRQLAAVHRKTAR